MSQVSRALYLPPGVSAPAPAVVPPVSGSSVPFDRVFFEQVLPQAIAAFCQQVDCDVPLVELLTVDGTSHYVKGISGVADSWVALHTIEQDHDHPIQVFIPYQTIFRVEVHPAENEPRHRLGFLLGGAKPEATPPAIVSPEVVSPAEPATPVAKAPTRRRGTKSTP